MAKNKHKKRLAYILLDPPCLGYRVDTFLRQLLLVYDRNPLKINNTISIMG